MAPASSTTSLLDSLKAIEILKGLVLDHARAIYGHSYPTSHHTFSVITCVMEWGTMQAPDDNYFAEVIVYTTPDSLVEWKLLLTGEESESDLEAMKSLYHTVQQQVGKISGGMNVGDVWNNAMATEAKGARTTEAADGA